MTLRLEHVPCARREATALVLALAQATSPRLVGGKAHNLRRAAALGIRVPEGVVLTTHVLEHHLASHGLRQAIADAVDRVRLAPAGLRGTVARESAAAIGSLVISAPLSPATRESLFASADALLRAGNVVVRSSAIGEDSGTDSFAGQLDSFLDIRERDELERAVLRCWASCWSERALAYRAARGTAERGMGVIVQRQVPALAAGVMFTSTTNGALLIEYTPGLSVDLVAGHVDPGRFVLHRDGTGFERLHEPERFDAHAEQAIADGDTWRRFAETATALERGLGGPQDVEWVLDSGGELHVVQSRPVTAPVAIPPRSREVRVRWSNANVNENFPAPISPLLYSIASAGYARYFRNLALAFGLSARRVAAIDDALRHIIGVHGARMYYNLTNIHTVLRAAPFGRHLVEAFNRFVGASGSEGREPIAAQGRVGEIVEVAWIAVRTAWTYRSLGRRVSAFERTIDAFAHRSDPRSLETLPARELRSLLGGLIDIRCHRWTNAALADTAAMTCYAALHRLVERAGVESGGTLHNTLLKAIPHLVSGEPVQRLWDLSRQVRGDAALTALFRLDDDAVLRAIRSDARFAGFRDEFDEYLARCGFRCSAELMLTTPSFQEDPAPMIETIRAYTRVEGESPAEALARQLEERRTETERLIRAVRGRRLSGYLPFLSLGRALRIVLGWTHAAIAFRERARLKQALLYSRCRCIALALGERLVADGQLALRDDVFWLTAGELDELVAGSAMFPHTTRELIAARKAAHAQLAAMSPPDSFTLPEGRYLALDGAPAFAPPSASTGGALSGTSACGGRATGRAVVLADVREAGRIVAGDILVTRQTDPGWAPVFFLIKGLVIERGGMLSHGAIVAREFGIPCVVGVHGATTAIAHGRTIVVDGDQGAVHVLD